MRRDPSSITIIGAGIGGLTAALCLHAKGHRVTLYEAAPQLRALGLGINLLPHGVRILHTLGLEERLARIAVPTKRLRYTTRFGKDILNEPRGREAGYHWPQYSIHRGELQMNLMEVVSERLGGTAIRAGRRCIGFEQDANGVRAVLVDAESGETVETAPADLLIGADGLHSAVRRRLYPQERPPSFAGIMMWRGVAERKRFLDGRTMVIAGDAEQKVVLYPISEEAERRGRSLVNWVAEIRVGGEQPPRPSDWWAEGVRSHFVPQFENWDLGFIRLADLFEETEHVYEFPMVDREPLPRWSFGRVTLLGDAAHPMYPIGANGASQCIIDAHALAQAVSAADSAEEALFDYENARREATAQVVLSNRRRGPEWVLEVARQRLPTPDAEPRDFISEAEMLAVSKQYQALAGFDRDTLNREGAGPVRVHREGNVGVRSRELQSARRRGPMAPLRSEAAQGRGETGMADLPRLDVVIGNNFGHLPMFVGAEKGFFKQHGVDAQMLVVDTGTDMVNAMHDGRAQIGDMSTTTYLKAVHAGEPFKVIGLIMNDATRDNCDDPLAIVTKRGRGIEAGDVSALKGKTIGLALGQTSDEYFKMVLRRNGLKYEDLTIKNIWSQFGLAPALAEGKVDAVVSWEPYVTQVLTEVADSYPVIRAGQYMSYVMVATAHGPTVEEKPQLVKAIAGGLAQSSHYTRNHRAEAVEIFAERVPGTDLAIGKKAVQHISYDPRLSPAVLRAFENAENEVLMNTLKGAPRLDVPSLFRPQFMAEVEQEHPEYFADLPPLE